MSSNLIIGFGISLVADRTIDKSVPLNHSQLDRPNNNCYKSPALSVAELGKSSELLQLWQLVLQASQKHMKLSLLFSSLAAVFLWDVTSGDGAIAIPVIHPVGMNQPISTDGSQSTLNAPSRLEVAQETWQSFSRPEGGFAVQMPPGTVREGVQPTETELGTIDIHLLGIDLPTRLYAVIYQDFPDALEGTTPESLLDSTLQGVMGNVSQRLQDDRSISLGSYPGVDLYYQGFDGLSYKQRLYIVNRRMYMLVAATSEVVSSNFVEDADRFLNSFELSLETP
ncbi:MAG: hypothetical protein WBB29_15505 [Geitlerinemataceae cyanobacterium]